MSDRRADDRERRIERRTFLSTAAVPLAAALGPVRSAASSPDPTSGARASQEPVRVGLIGAGANVQAVQIPGFRAIPAVEIVAVANRSLESSRRVADAFEIPRAYASWDELLDDEAVDAVLIGTWPYMHRTLTLAALERNKHVLCQARMANNAEEARDMLEASLRHPSLVSQLVPTSTSYQIDNVLHRLLEEGFVGDVLSVEVQRLSRGFAARDGVLDWRHDSEFSGLNAMNLGSTYESMMRWLGPGDRIQAMASVHVPYRSDAAGRQTAVTVPDHVDVLYELANRAQVHMRFSETTGLSEGNQTWIFGTEGTIHVDAGQNVFGGSRGATQLSPIPNPVDEQAYYRVEEEFVNAVRGVEEVTMATFETGVRYMEWTEAVHRSARTGQAVSLPL